MPSLRILADNALAEDNSILIQAQPQFLFAKSLEQRLQTIHKVRR